MREEVFWCNTFSDTATEDAGIVRGKLQGLGEGNNHQVFGDNDDHLCTLEREDAEQVGLIERGTDSETLEPARRQDAFACTTADGEPLKAREEGDVWLTNLVRKVPLSLADPVEELSDVVVHVFELLLPDAD